ncbi:TPA: DUF1064 domain-containing protein [Clostridioides difficile]|uniref:DUF1064 domain-containing protein n=1 Tax=Clostridioides difficile TaxID=1496 RepID=UPI001C178CC4|nr:DUF1064 domain-containing protein [Clostridioides difficile]MDV9710582.1 DUF1064 domain-containing protein [Clostridioides difficile]UUC40677.1 DUF1064 domain-containing protein [Clostridioides difficile]HBF5147629.1 DUF1064 domain-containing protein [Clostridioides difficile]HBF6468904.1 DUF1064 domain-containing protein [Clostridioides difficile]HBH3651452.1 DUF1064 domain-containing protein [Clostridioides difficile]
MSKYNNKKIVIDGIKFDSKDESEYYLYLKEKKENGEIKDFGLQQKFELQPKFKKDGKSYRAITYIVDFAIYKWNGDVVYIDVKGYSTQQGELRKKLFDYKYQDKILIWISKSKKYGVDGWIEYDELKKKRKENKKKVA